MGGNEWSPWSEWVMPDAGQRINGTAASLKLNSLSLRAIAPHHPPHPPRYVKQLFVPQVKG